MKLKSNFSKYIIATILLVTLLGSGAYFYPKLTNSMLKREPDFISNIDITEQKKIYYIIDTMANTGVIGLAFKQGRLKKVGREIGHIAPLEFLAVIFSDPYLSKCMLSIKESSLKYNHFIEGMQKNMMIQYQSGALLKRIPDFSRQVRVDQNELTKRIKKSIKLATRRGDKRAFKPFVDYLIIITNQK